MKVAEFLNYGFNNTSFTVMKKTLNISVSVSLFINFHKLRCPVVYNYQNLFNLGVCKGVKSFCKQSRNYTVYSKTVVKANCVDKQYRFPLIYMCKTPDKAALVKYQYFIEVNSHSNKHHWLAHI